MILVTSSAIQRVELWQSLIQRRLLVKKLVTSSSLKKRSLCITLSASKWWSSTRVSFGEMYYEFYQQEVELKEAAWRKVVITSSTSKRWSSRIA